MPIEILLHLIGGRSPPYEEKDQNLDYRVRGIINVEFIHVGWALPIEILLHLIGGRSPPYQ